MSSPPALPAVCHSSMAIRVEDTIQTTLLGIEPVPAPPGLSLAQRASVSVPISTLRRPSKRPPKKPPPPPPSVPADDPLEEVPPLSLDTEKADDAWQTLDGIAAWPREELRDFAAAHEDICILHARGALEPMVFERHMLRLPLQVRKGLK